MVSHSQVITLEMTGGDSSGAHKSQLQLSQNEVLTELAQSLAADRAILREFLASGGCGDEQRGAGAVPHSYIPKMREADDAEAFLETF
ncbi:unnamed protein product [Boreogadus saida]